MRLASPQPASFADAPSLRRRAIAFALAVLANLLILLLLLGLAPSMPFLSMAKHGPITVQLLPAAQTQAAGGRQVARAQRATRSASRPKSASRPPPPTVPPPPIPQKPDRPLDNVLILSHEDYAASDIAKLPSHKAEQQANAGEEGGGAGRGSGAGSSAGAGIGPGGQQLYAAEWYREPTHAELSTYLPRSATAGAWGEVACRTVARYHVEDCQELADTPGSGLARAVREAAWQFLVRPPRVNGQPMVGSWVRIRITITPEGDIERP